jgi:ABC transport system ATP-binding/permease protein
MPTFSKPSDHTVTLGEKRKSLPTALGAILEFTDGDEAGRRVALVFERTILGRKSGDILVRDITVSGTHLALEFRRGIFRVVDLGSSNGTFVGGEKVGERSIQTNDEVRIGECAFRIRFDPALAAKILAEQPVHAGDLVGGLTDLIEREFVRSEGGEETLMIGPSSERAEGGRIRLGVAAGPDRGKSVLFSKSSFSIGRVGVDLPLRDPDASRKHAVLERGEGGQVILRDLASANGTLVNGKRVVNCVLAPGDKIQVGQSTIVFVGIEKG